MRLRTEYPDAIPLLDFRNEYELLVAVVLSAQTTDAQVNRITPELFRRFRGPAELAAAPIEELEQLVHSTGFYRTKAKNIRGAAKMLVERHGGTVPNRMEDLVELPGVGRKSANVILSHAHGLPGIIVDTHFGRVTRRLDLTRSQNPAHVERDIAGILNPSDHTAFSMTVNYHGRYCCKARVPECYRCAIRDLCPFTPKTTERPA